MALEEQRLDRVCQQDVGTHDDAPPPLPPAPPPDEATPAGLLAALDKTFALLRQLRAWPPLSRRRENERDEAMIALQGSIMKLREIVQAAAKPPKHAKPVDDGIPDFLRRSV